ncbi:hypothetical protein [Rhodopila sp.]|uniref:hypothetical protein n=1 Tax=Rhodopila sp. TaxID=2480087 RepID=UPI003D0A8293
MKALATVAAGLQGALRLASGRADGVILVSGDRDSATRSFWAIAFCIPSVVCRLLMSWAEVGMPADPAHLMGREMMIFILGWLVFVEATHFLAPTLGRAERWGRFIAVWNWCNVVEGVLVIIGGLPGLLGAPSVIAEACELVTIGWALWLEWYATRLAFGIGAATAGGLVLLDQLIGILLATVAMAIGG